MSPTIPASADQPSGADADFQFETGQQTIAVSSSSQTTHLPLRVNSGTSFVTESTSSVPNAEPRTSSKPDLLLKAAVPHTVTKSALSFSRLRLHVADKDKVMLTDNPLYWDVSRLLDFIEQTDCASLKEKLSDHVSIYLLPFIVAF